MADSEEVVAIVVVAFVFGIVALLFTCLFVSIARKCREEATPKPEPKPKVKPAPSIGDTESGLTPYPVRNGIITIHEDLTAYPIASESNTTPNTLEGADLNVVPQQNMTRSATENNRTNTNADILD